jgi:hypothetical protein
MSQQYGAVKSRELLNLRQIQLYLRVTGAVISPALTTISGNVATPSPLVYLGFVNLNVTPTIRDITKGQRGKHYSTRVWVHFSKLTSILLKKFPLF